MKRAVELLSICGYLGLPVRAQDAISPVIRISD